MENKTIMRVWNSMSLSDDNFCFWVNYCFNSPFNHFTKGRLGRKILKMFLYIKSS